LGATSAGGTSRTSALLPPPSGFEVYDIGNNNITNAAFIGTVGLEWQFAGIAPVSRTWCVRSRVAQRQ